MVGRGGGGGPLGPYTRVYAYGGVSTNLHFLCVFDSRGGEGGPLGARYAPTRYPPGDPPFTINYKKKLKTPTPREKAIAKEY